MTTKRVRIAVFWAPILLPILLTILLPNLLPQTFPNTFTAWSATADADLSEVKQRMLRRLPAVQELKREGIIGENNKGYLEYVGNEKVGQDVVEAENADRRMVYTAIAKQQNTTPEVVGVHRAAQISARADPGDYLQDASGKWYRK